MRVETDAPSQVDVGALVEVRAQIQLGSIAPEDVSVELYQGAVDADRDIQDGSAIAMIAIERNGDGSCGYAGAIPCSTSGLQGYALRVLPKNPDLTNPFEPGLIHWAQ